MMDRTYFSLTTTNSTSGGKSPPLTTNLLVNANGSDGHGAMSYLVQVSTMIDKNDSIN